MSTGTSLVRAWEGPGDKLAWRDPSVERVLINRKDPPCTIVHLRRSPPERVTAPGCTPVGRNDVTPGRPGLPRDPDHPGDHAPDPVPADEHLAAGPDERSRPWLSCADVIVRWAEERTPAARALAEVHTRFPGCLVAALIGYGDGCILGTVSGWHARLVPLRIGTCTDNDVSSYASAVHTWIASGRSPIGLDAARLTVIRGRAAAKPGVLVMMEGRGMRDGFRRADS